MVVDHRNCILEHKPISCPRSGAGRHKQDCNPKRWQWTGSPARNLTCRAISLKQCRENVSIYIYSLIRSWSRKVRTVALYHKQHIWLQRCFGRRKCFWRIWMTAYSRWVDQRQKKKRRPKKQKPQPKNPESGTTGSDVGSLKAQKIVDQCFAFLFQLWSFLLVWAVFHLGLSNLSGWSVESEESAKNVQQTTKPTNKNKVVKMEFLKSLNQ